MLFVSVFRTEDGVRLFIEAAVGHFRAFQMVAPLAGRHGTSKGCMALVTHRTSQFSASFHFIPYSHPLPILILVALRRPLHAGFMHMQCHAIPPIHGQKFPAPSSTEGAHFRPFSSCTHFTGTPPPLHLLHLSLSLSLLLNKIHHHILIALSLFLSAYQHAVFIIPLSNTHIHILSLSLAFIYSHTHTLSLSLSRIHSHTHTHTLSLSLSDSLTHTVSLPAIFLRAGVSLSGTHTRYLYTQRNDTTRDKGGCTLN